MSDSSVSRRLCRSPSVFPGPAHPTMLKNRTPILFLNVLIIATCGLVYELLAGTVASYVLGDSVTQFSLIIGIYLFAMGAGAWISRFIEDGCQEVLESIGGALLGGLSAPLLF